MWNRNSEQARGIAAGDHGSLLGREILGAVQETQGIIFPHVVGIVGAEKQMICAVFSHEEFHVAWAEDHRVEVQAAQIITGGAAESASTVRPCLIPMVHSCSVGGQVSTAVRKAEFEPGMAFEHSIEYQVAGCNCCLKGVSNEIYEVMLRQALSIGDSVWMKKDHGTEFLCFGKEGSKCGIRKLAIADATADLDTSKSEILNQARQLQDSEFRSLKRYCSEASESIGSTCRHFCDRIVNRSCNAKREVRLGPICELKRRGRQNLKIYSHPVHILQPGRKIGQSRPKLLHLGAIYFSARVCGKGKHRLDGLRARGFQQLVCFVYMHVAVYVDTKRHRACPRYQLRSSFARHWVSARKQGFGHVGKRFSVGVPKCSIDQSGRRSAVTASADICSASAV
jgi:hypothetical protein